MRLSIKRVLTKPVAPFDPSTMYIVQGTSPTRCELYFSDATGATLRNPVTEQEASDLISAQLAGFSNIHAVADITARNALNLTSSGMVMVADAFVVSEPANNAYVSTPGTAAMYMFNAQAVAPAPEWTKIYEFEGMDVQLLWANLVDKPTSSVADIEAAVALQHDHGTDLDQLPILDGLAVNPATGNLVFNNIELASGAPLDSSEW